MLGIVQARVGSTRLPGKVLRKIKGKTVLEHVLERLKKARLINKVIVATTLNPLDGVVEKIALSNGVDCFRGSEDDVLDRYFQAALKFKADEVVRITSDCPLLDPEIVDKVISCYQTGGFDYVSNTLHPTYPDGLDVEVFSFRALEKSWEGASKPSEREHVTAYIWNHPESFNLGQVRNEVDLSHLRWTLDTREDWKFIRAIYNCLYSGSAIFHMAEVLQLLEERPELMQINQGISRNSGYFKSLEKDKG